MPLYYYGGYRLGQGWSERYNYFSIIVLSNDKKEAMQKIQSNLRKMGLEKAAKKLKTYDIKEADFDTTKSAIINIQDINLEDIEESDEDDE